MNQILQRFMWAALIAPIVLFTSLVHANSGESVGKVLVAKGDVFAVTDQGERKLRRRADIFEGDLIRTEGNGSTQVRFIDGAIVALSENSELHVESYQYDEKNPTADSSVLTLLKGGFKTITGNIGKRDPNRYSLKAGQATIGIRGTAYEVRLGEKIAVGVWKGGISVKNDKGSVELGEGAQYNYAVIESGQPPQPKLKPPKGLTGPDQTGEAEGDASTTSSDQKNDAKQEESGEQTEEQEQAVLDDVSPYQAKADDEADASEEPVLSNDDSTAPAAASDTNTTTGATEPSVSETTATAASGVDLRLTDTEKASLDRIGLLVIGQQGTNKFFGGEANADVQKPIIVDYGVGPDEPGFGTVTPVAVFKAGDATIGTWAAEAGYIGQDLSSGDLRWGFWGQPGAAEVLKDPNSSVGDPINYPVFWITGKPTDPSVIAAQSGYITYSEVYSYRGGGSTGNVTAISAYIPVDFSTGVATGATMSITTTGADWAVNFNATVEGQTLSVDNNVAGSFSATVNTGGGPVAADGSVGMVFIGNNAQGVMGGYDLQKIGDDSIHTEGVFAIGQY